MLYRGAVELASTSVNSRRDGERGRCSAFLTMEDGDAWLCHRQVGPGARKGHGVTARLFVGPAGGVGLRCGEKGEMGLGVRRRRSCFLSFFFYFFLKCAVFQLANFSSKPMRFFFKYNVLFSNPLNFFQIE